MKWTTDQEQAIAARQCNLLVSAAAGSGKTALLIERIRRLVAEEGVPVDSLLVLTFTRAAAGEMKERLSKALLAELSQAGRGPGNARDDGAAWLLEQVHRLPGASISTIHAFCGSLVREYFQEAGVDPEYRVGEDTELAILRREALEEVFEAHYQAIPEDGATDFSRLVDMFTGNRDDKDLMDLVERTDRFLSSLEDPQGWCGEAVARLKMGAGGFGDSILWQIVAEDVRRDLEAAVRLLEKGLALTQGTTLFEKTAAQLEGDIRTVGAVIPAIDGGYDALRGALRAVAFPTYKGSREDKETSDTIKDLRSEARDIVKGWQGELADTLEEAAADMAEMAGPMADLLGLTQDFVQAYRARKARKNLLDFSDTERLTLKILDNPVIAGEVRGRYRHVFIDEYQDTNAMQEAILRRIVREDNYFMVGDVKQSIYRFRLADPGIFLEKYRDFGEGGDPRSRLVTLGQNFRSSRGVIDGVNTLFTRIMSPALGEVAYDERARLYPGVTEEESPETMAVHVMERGAGDADELEARFIAGRINAMVGRPVTVAKEGRTRPLRYRDVGVFLRAVAGRGDVFARIFAEEGIPAYFEGGATYYASSEISLILDLVRVVDNYRQDVPLMAVMLSPIGGFGAEECARIRLMGSGGAYYTCLDACAAGDATALGDKVRGFLKRLEDWNRDAHRMAVADFLWKLYADTDYYIYAGSLPGGAQRQKNLRSLLDKAAAYKSSTMMGVFNFVDYVERMKDHDYDTSPPGILSESDDVVRIMTIHKSKGLEFPVVFVAGMGRQFNRRGAGGRVLFHKHLGIAPQLIRPGERTLAPTLAYRVARGRITTESLSEEMRLLYVAMTRAMERLELVGSVRDLEKSQARWSQEADTYHLMKASSFLDWVMLALGKDNGGGAADIHLHPAGGVPASRPDAEKSPDGATDAGLAAEIERRLQWRPEDEAAGMEPPVKLSVTEVARTLKMDDLSAEKGIEIPERVACPDFMVNGVNAFSAAELGTGIHAVMQGIRLERLRGLDGAEAMAPVVAEECRRLVDCQILHPELAAALDLGPVAAFYASALGRRLLSSPRVMRERPFNYPVDAGRVNGQWQQKGERIILQGMIDCCFEEAGGWILLDYKTNRWTSPEERAALISRYRTQIELYAEALDRLTAMPVTARTLCFLTMGEWVEM